MSDQVRELGDGDDAKTVKTESGEEVRLSYRRACHDYAIGVSTAFFMATTVLGFVILWQDHIPRSVFATAVPFFVAFSVVGFIVFGIGYTHPVRLYELMEDRDE